MLQKSKLGDGHISYRTHWLSYFFLNNFNSYSVNSLRELLWKKRGIMTDHYDLPSVQLGLTA